MAKGEKVERKEAPKREEKDFGEPPARPVSPPAKDDKKAAAKKVEKVEEVETFFQEHKYPKNNRRISQIVEAMRTNGKLLLNLQGSELSKPFFWDDLQK